MGKNAGTPPTKCSATNPGFGIWDFAWNFAIRVKFGTCEQKLGFFWDQDSGLSLLTCYVLVKAQLEIYHKV